MDRDRVIGLAAKVLAGVLFAVSLLGVVGSALAGDTAGLVTGLFAVYLTGLLFVGVLRGTTQTQFWQVAFFAGVAVWGGYEYATQGDFVSLLLAVVGVVMVAANLFAER